MPRPIAASALILTKQFERLASLDSVDPGGVGADDFLAGLGRHRLDQFTQLRHVIPGMVEVRKIRRPEKFVGSDEIDDVAEGLFIRVAGDPALPIKIVTRLLLQPDRLAK